MCTRACPAYVKRVVRREHHFCPLSSMVRWGVAAPPFHTKCVFSVTAATLFFRGSELSSVVRSGRCVSEFGSDQNAWLGANTIFTRYRGVSSMVRWGVAAPPFHTKCVFSVTAATLFFRGSELSSVVRSGRCVSKFGSDQIFRNLAKHISGGEKTQKTLRSMVASVFRVCSGSFLILFGILRLRGMPILGMQVVFLETRFVGFPMKAHHFCTLSSMVRSEVVFRWFPLREGFRASGSTKCANFYAYPM